PSPPSPSTTLFRSYDANLTKKGKKYARVLYRREAALLSEIAALRGERDRLAEELHNEIMVCAGKSCDADVAERQRDKLRKALPDLSSVIAWLDNGCEPKHAVTELGIHKARIDQALANQGADQ